MEAGAKKRGRPVKHKDECFPEQHAKAGQRIFDAVVDDNNLVVCVACNGQRLSVSNIHRHVRTKGHIDRVAGGLARPPHSAPAVPDDQQDVLESDVCDSSTDEDDAADYFCDACGKNILSQRRRHCVSAVHVINQFVMTYNEQQHQILLGRVKYEDHKKVKKVECYCCNVHIIAGPNDSEIDAVGKYAASHHCHKPDVDTLRDEDKSRPEVRTDAHLFLDPVLHHVLHPSHRENMMKFRQTSLHEHGVRSVSGEEIFKQMEKARLAAIREGTAADVDLAAQVNRVVHEYLSLSGQFPVPAEEMTKLPTMEERAAIFEGFSNRFSKVKPHTCGTCNKIILRKDPLEQVSLDDAVAHYPTLVFADEKLKFQHVLHSYTHNRQVLHVNASSVAIDEEGVAKLSMCDTCIEEGPKSEWMADGFDYGRSLEELGLPELNPAEASAIAISHAFTTILEIRHHKSPSSTFKKHTISMPSESPQLQPKAILPSTRQQVYVKFIGKESFGKLKNCVRFRESVSVRPDRIRQWLMFLKEYNVLYKDIIISDDNIKVLANHMADTIINNSTVVTDVEEIAMAVRANRKDPTAPEQATETNTVLYPKMNRSNEAAQLTKILRRNLRELRKEAGGTVLPDRETNLGRIEVSSDEEPEHEVKDHGKPADNRSTQTAQSTAKSTPKMPIKIDLSAPLSEWDQGDLILAGGSPHLFPVLTEEGRKKLCKPLKQAAVNALMMAHEERFRTDGNLLFTIFDQKRRHPLVTSLSAKPKSIARIKEIFEDARIDAIIDPETKDPECRRLAKELEQLVSYITEVAPLSSSSRRSVKQSLEAMRIFHGQPPLFVTVNPDDNNLFVTIEAISHGKPVVRDVLLKDAVKRIEAVQHNPIWAAKTFDLMMQVVCELVFGVKQVKLTRKSHCGWMGLFGLGKQLVGVVEAQGRGSLHCHFIFWTHDLSRFVAHQSDKSSFVQSTVTFMNKISQTSSFRRRMCQFQSVRFDSKCSCATIACGL